MLEHGGRLRVAAEHYGIAEADWLDLSTGLAPWPFPIPPIPLRAWARLPENRDGLEQAACAYYAAPRVLPVPGTQAAIQTLPRLRRPGRVGVLSPCYAEHAEAWRNGGFLVRELAQEEVEYFIEHLDVLVVVNPNNPTGLQLAPELLLEWHARLAERGGWLVVDEAFMDVTPQQSLASETERSGLIVLRSFGKFFGLAGVRLGFVLGETSLLNQLERQIGPWAVSGPTRVVGKVCLEDRLTQLEQRQRSAQASARLSALLSQHGLQPQGGCALFQWVVTPQAKVLHEFCARRGILLRLFASGDTHTDSLRFGLPANEQDWQRFESALIDYHGQSR